MNILLVYPEVPDTFWSFKHALKFINKKVSSQPLGLMTIASLLPKQWNIKLVDTNINKLSQSDLSWADYVFISAMSIQKESAAKIIMQCNNAGKTIVAGGPLFTAEHESFDTVEHFVLNEAEITLPDFLQDLNNGSPKRIYTTTIFPDIKNSPIPMWELADFKSYAMMNIQFSRGCPYDCEFCNITTLFGDSPRTKKVSQVIAELDKLYQAGWRKSIFFVDDNFIGNKKLLKTELLPELIKWRKGKNGITFSTEVSINISDDAELMNLMVAAGFETVFIGIETPDEVSLAECNKKQNLHRDLVSCVKRIQRMGLQVQAGFILGFDNDNQSTFQSVIDFIQKSGIVTAMVGLLQAPKDTLLYNRLMEQGRIVEMMSGDNADGTTNIVPIMDIDTLKIGYKRVLNQLYSPKLFNKRVKTFLNEYRAPQNKSRMDFKNFVIVIAAFVRSIYISGLLDKERSHYWKLVVWTMFRKPSLMNLSITFAIYGYHFRMMCQHHIK